MAYYKVGSDGKAPAGMAVGDQIVTGGGTYDISKVLDAASAKYETGNHNPNLTTYNFTGQYANAPQTSQAQQVAQATSPASAAWGQTGSNAAGLYSGSVNADGSAATQVSNAGQGQLSMDPTTGRIIRTMPDGRAWYVDPGDAKYGALYQEYIGTPAGQAAAAANSQAANIAGIQSAIAGLQGISTPAYVAPDTAQQKALANQYMQELANLQYNPVDMNAYLGDVGSYEDYVQQAIDALTPGYKKQYDQAYMTAAQNLDRAGLFNTLYGQALVDQQQNAVTDALMAEASKLGLDLRDRAYDEAFQRYQAAVNENQYGTSFKQTNLSQAGSMMMDYIGVLNQEAKNQNDYNLQAQLNQIQQYTAAVDAYAQSGKLTQYQYENMMTVAEIELSKIEGQLKTAEIANTNADTEKIKAQTQAIMAELAGFSGASSGYGYGGGYYSSDYGSGDNVSLDNGGGNNTPAAELYDYYAASNGDKSLYLAMAQAAGYDKKNADYYYVNTDKFTQLNNTAYDATKTEKKDPYKGKYSKTGAGSIK